MGIRSIMKYLALLNIVSVLIEKGSKWLEAAKDEDSPGGGDITAEEYLELIPVVEEAIVAAIGVSVVVTIEPKEV